MWAETCFFRVLAFGPCSSFIGPETKKNILSYFCFFEFFDFKFNFFKIKKIKNSKIVFCLHKSPRKRGTFKNPAFHQNPPMICGVCRAACLGPKQHPCFATGDLGSLLVCDACMPRFAGGWQLSKTGKHQWCRVCAVQSERVRELRAAVGLRTAERRLLKKAGELDGKGAALYTCDVCPEAFCSVCTMRLFSIGAMLKARSAGHWKCPVCTADKMLQPKPRGAVF